MLEKFFNAEMLKYAEDFGWEIRCRSVGCAYGRKIFMIYTCGSEFRVSSKLSGSRFKVSRFALFFIAIILCIAAYISLTLARQAGFNLHLSPTVSLCSYKY
ncbi:MAG: hypothetical protein JRJ65_09500 [Deltaproteobacteria bacterium]|nr:hypothetical protein [Deltaproteobacteria bacterium]